MPPYSIKIFSNAWSSKSRTMSALRLVSNHLMVRSRFFFTSVRRRLNASVLIFSLVWNRSESVQMPYTTILSRDVALMPITLQLCFMFSSIVNRQRSNLIEETMALAGTTVPQTTASAMLCMLRMVRYESDGFYGGFVCVSTGVLLCALCNVGFGDFFWLLNSDVRRNTCSLRKHWWLIIKIYLSSVSFS